MSAAQKGKKRRKPFECWAVLTPFYDSDREFVFRTDYRTKEIAREDAGCGRVVKLREVED